MDEKIYVFIDLNALRPFHNVEDDLENIKQAINNRPLEFIKGYLSNSRDGVVDIVEQSDLVAYINKNEARKHCLEISVYTDGPTDLREIKAISVDMSKLPASDQIVMPGFSKLHGKSAAFIEGYLSSLVTPNAYVALSMAGILHRLNNPAAYCSKTYRYYEV